MLSNKFVDKLVIDMMNVELIDFLEEQGYTYFEDEERFKASYPASRGYGEYCVCPRSYPDQYPCLARSEDIWYNPNGQDEHIMSFIYLQQGG